MVELGTQFWVAFGLISASVLAALGLIAFIVYTWVNRRRPIIDAIGSRL